MATVALEEAIAVGGRMVGPEHLLLAIAREDECVAMGIMTDLGVTADVIRERMRPRLPGPLRTRTRVVRHEVDPTPGIEFTATPDAQLRVRLMSAVGTR